MVGPAPRARAHFSLHVQCSKKAHEFSSSYHYNLLAIGSVSMPHCMLRARGDGSRSGPRTPRRAAPHRSPCTETDSTHRTRRPLSLTGSHAAE